MIKSKFLFLLSLISLSFVAGESTTNFAKANKTYNVKNTATINEFNDGRFTYAGVNGFTTSLLSPSEASDENLPEGYENYVLKLGPASTPLMEVDFSCGNYQISDIKAVVFRVCATGTVSGTYPAFRLKKDTSDPYWRMLGTGDFADGGGVSLKTVINTWYEVRLDASTFAKDTNFAFFASASNPDILGKMTITYRTADACSLYFDDIRVETNSEIVKDFTNDHQFAIAQHDGSVAYLTEDEAKAAGINGASGSVLKLTGSISESFWLDYSASKIKLSKIEKITFRVYVTGAVSGKKPELRVQNVNFADPEWCFVPSNKSDPMYGDAGFTFSSHLNEWLELTMDVSTINGNKGWSTFADQTDPSILGKLLIMLRAADANSVLYVDSITIALDNSNEEFTNNKFEWSSAAGSVSLLKESEVASEGIAAGYENSVLKMTNSISATTLLDFTSADIKLCLIESITFKIYATGNPSGKKPEFRVQNINHADPEWCFVPSTKSDPMYGDGGYTLASHLNEWLVLTMDTTTINGNRGWDTFADQTDPTRLGKMTLMYRCANNTDTLYIDSITVTMKENDHVAPVITYNGPTELTVHAEQTIMVDATAFDAQENREVEVEYVFDENAITHDNKISNQGTFTLTLKATDYYGNYSTVDINITVLEQDTVAPTINISDSLTVKAGTNINQLNVGEAVSDNSGQFTLDVVFSDGTYNAAGELLAGTHTMTVTATDLSENQTVKVVTLNVISNGEVTEGFETEDGDLQSVINFVDEYMHMDDYKESLGYCKDQEHNYYGLAKESYNDLSLKAKEMFNNMERFADAKERLLAWAEANNDTLDETYTLVAAIRRSSITSISSNCDSLIFIVAGLSLVALFFFCMKKKAK